MNRLWLLSITAFLCFSTGLALGKKTSPVKVDSIGVRVDILRGTKPGAYVLGDSGEIVFEQKTSALALTCHIPISIQLLGNTDAFNVALSARMGEIDKDLQKKMNAVTPEAGQKASLDFRSGLFTVEAGKAKALSGGSLSNLLGVYRLKKQEELKVFDPSTLLAFMNEKNLGFILPLPNEYKNVATLALSRKSPSEDDKNVLCAEIGKKGFVVNAGK